MRGGAGYAPGVNALARTCLVALLVSLAAWGCETRVSLGARCTSEVDCPGDPVCRFGRCRAECTSAADCDGPGAFCIGAAGAGVCTVPAADRCVASCTDGLVCAGEICGVPCTPLGDECLDGSSCGPDAICVADDSSSDAGAIDAGALDAGSVDAGALDVGTDAGAPSAWPHHQICNGFALVCAVRDGRVFCWGNDHHDQLGDGVDDHGGRCPFVERTYDCASVPMAPVLEDTSGTELTGVVAVGCGEASACALTGSGRVLCWGLPGPHLGAGNVPVAPRAVQAVAAGATALTVGWAHTCALVDGAPRCWGANGEPGMEDGRLGLTGVSSLDVPTPAPSLADLAPLGAGRVATCGVEASGAVRCHGSAAEGIADPAGRTIVGATAVTTLSVGAAHGCALAREGLVCWGNNASGQLGDGSGGPECGGFCRVAAEPVVGSEGVALRALSHGASEHTCAITERGEVRCWGSQPCGDAGVDPEMGRVDSIRMLGPAVRRADDTVLTDVVEVAVGSSTCARTASGEVWCWGNNNYGQLGFFETTPPAPGCLSQAHPTAHAIPFPAR